MSEHRTDIARPVEKEPDPLLALRGSGRELWADEHADEYVRRLREEWKVIGHAHETPRSVTVQSPPRLG